MKLEDFKMYDVKVTGEVVLDPATKLPAKNEDGSLKVKWMRDSNPSAELKAKGIGSGRFFQTEMIETNTVAATMTLPGGKTAEIGPLSASGITVNLFESQQREPFNAIALKILANDFTVVKPAAEGVKPVIKINNYVQPGEQVEYQCIQNGQQFEYYQHRRNPVTHIDEPTLVWAYDEKGKLVQQKVIRSTGQIFLFANELEAKEAHKQSAINSHIPFKVTVEGMRVKADAGNKVEATASADVPTV